MTSTPPPGPPGAAPGPPPPDPGAAPGPSPATGDPGDAGDPQGTTPADRFFASLRSVDLRRGEDRWLAGVCSGVAHRLGVDPAIVRVGFVLLALLAGFGIGLYLLGWLLVPEHERAPHLERAVRGGEAGSIVLLVVTALVVLGNLPWWDAWSGSWWAMAWWLVWVAVVLLVVWGLVRLLGRRPAGPGSGDGATTAGYAAPPPPAAHSPSGVAGEPGPAGAPGRAFAARSSSGGTGAVAPPPGGYPPPPPVAGRRRGPGAAVSLLVLGLALAALGGLWWGAMTADWPGNPFTVAVAGALALLGAAVLVLGLAGRRAGLPGGLAVVALLLTLVTAPAPDDYRPSTRFGEQTWRPSATALAEPGPVTYRHGLGVAVLDLRDLDPAELPPGAELHASVDIGQLVVRVPEGMVVDIDGTTAVGALTLRDGTDVTEPPWQTTGGLGISEHLVTGTGGEETTAAEPDLHLRVRVGIGEVSVREDRA